MAENVTLDAKRRGTVGTRAARKLRQDGQLPAVIYGHGEAVESIALKQHDVEVALKHGARTAELRIGRKSQQCLIKVVQYDHLGITPIHLDFTRVDVHERVRVTVGIELRGTPKGLAHGGVLDLQLAEIEIECLASEIPETLRPIVTDLDVGESLRVKDLNLPKGVVAMADGDERIATVHAKAKSEEDDEETSEEESGEPTPEPERIGRVRKEDEKT